MTGSMRLSRAIRLVVMVAILSTLITICLWSSCARHTDSRLNDGSASFVLTNYHKRGTSSINDGDSDDVNSVNRNNNNGRNVAAAAVGGDAGDGVQLMAVSMGSPDHESCHPVDCNINNERVIECRKDGDQVYMPFDFIKEYFEVYGDVDRSESRERLDFHHANSIVHPPRTTYRPDAVFMAFDHYNVENRDRVRCITASEGVPITTQWSKEGYHYPIQVAQYALSHHAKHILLQSPPEVTPLEDGEAENRVNLIIPDDEKSTIKRQEQNPSGNHVMEFKTSDSLYTKGIIIRPGEKLNKCFRLDIKFVTNGSITVFIATSAGEMIKIHYLFSKKHVAFDGKSNIFYGLGDQRMDWIHLARDLKVDLLKGLLCKFKMDRIKNGFSLAKILEFRIRGHGWFDNFTLSRSIHMDQFYDAANWLVRHQDSRGGWPVMVERVLTGFPPLPPGWYSAMGQGQAMSVLIRAYLDSRSKTYLDAAVSALQLFQVDSTHGGVRARFFDKYDWYEEYPTTPSSFVLNGFIYSLLGLYDLKETATGESQALAERIYNSGMTSLKHMIGMYDSGAGTLYDLRHITVGTQPNRARWDYHTTHINQILQLMIIDDDEILQTTVQRWIGYLKGKKSRHN